jgi:F-type H+-transporting ATPase subunit g
MASLLRQMQSKAAVATEIATKRSSAFYKQLMEDNKHHVVEPATVQKCQELSKQLFYTRLSRSVPAILLSRVRDAFPP